MRTNYSIKNSVTSFISNIVSFLLLFISQTIFIKVLGIEYNGLNGLFSNVLIFLSLFELGIGNAIIYNLYKYIAKDNKEKIKSIMHFYKKTYSIIALLILIVGLFLTPFIKYMINDVNIDVNIYLVYILFLITTVSTYLISYRRNLLFAYQKKYILNIVHLVYIVILNLLQILLLLLTKNYYLYLIIKIICILLENIYIHIRVGKEYRYLLDKEYKQIDKNTKKDIIKRVKALFIHKVSAVITYGTDNILISIFFSIKDVGIYTNYNYIISKVDLLFRDIIDSTTASVGNLLVSKDYDKRYSVYRKIKFLNLWIAIVTSVCLVVLLNPFIKIWIGKKYLLTSIVVIVLIINYFQSMMRSTYNIFKDAAGIWVEDKYIPIIQSILNIISSIIFLKIFGLVGIFMGTIFSTVVLWFYSYPKFVYRKLFKKDYKSYFKEIFKSCLIFSLIISICLYISNLIVLNNLLLELVLKLVISLVLSNILLLIIFIKNDSFKYYIDLIKKKLFSKA